jgi:hypothetical protein
MNDIDTNFLEETLYLVQQELSNSWVFKFPVHLQAYNNCISVYYE